ncbi:hypothetical protein ACGVWS_08970 [Enterobacteriaceae bacterium LUAb1]
MTYYVHILNDLTALHQQITYKGSTDSLIIEAVKSRPNQPDADYVRMISLKNNSGEKNGDD